MTSLSEPEVLVGAEQLGRTMRGVLSGLGASDAHATAVAELLVEADLSGVDSHGCHLLPMYVTRVSAGQIDPVAAVRVLRDDGSSVWLDAGLGFGQPAGLRAVDLVTERAAAHGTAVVSVREATHLGALGAYTRRVAEAGCIALCVQNGPTVVPPFGGVTPMFSTNPISYAFTNAEEQTVVFDVATTAVAGNKLLLAKKRGDTTIPAGWANDENGRPTTDAQAASVWNLQWFGGHKGYGLAFFIEVLAGVLAGSSYGRTEKTASPAHGRERVAKGFTLIAIDPDRFIGRAELGRRVDELVRDVHASTSAEGFGPILVPGELEHHRRIQRRRDGIPLARAIVDELETMAQKYSAPPLLSNLS